ncbi:MAG: bacillithiol system redox-active protein YtxJ [Bacteroidota bacterium]|jgi:bacillithiol system protein YtxJ
MGWNRLENFKQVGDIVAASARKPQLIFKHSTRCSISEAAKYRLDADLDGLKSVCDVHYLDLLSYRDISKLVAERFDVVHQSPQVILVKGGRPVYVRSHYDINARELMSKASSPEQGTAANS